MTTITEPGFYDIPEDAYHADPCVAPSLSKSIGSIMLQQSPQHGWCAHPRLNPDHQPVQRTIYDIGHAAEAMVMGLDRKFDVIAAADFKTKAAREARDAAWEAGRIPLLAEKFEDVRRMAAAARAQLNDHRDAAAAFTGGRAQQTMVWRETVNGVTVWCRALLDWKPEDEAAPGRVTLDDFKSTEGSANPDVWINRLYDNGSDVQAAFYIRGYSTLTGRDPADIDFRFVVQESKSPYALCVVGLDPRALELANAKVDDMIDLWARCMEADTWPGYPAHTCWLTPPVREEYRRQDRTLRREAMTKAGIDEFDSLMRFYAPLGQTILGGG